MANDGVHSQLPKQVTLARVFLPSFDGVDAGIVVVVTGLVVCSDVAVDVKAVDLVDGVDTGVVVVAGLVVSTNVTGIVVPIGSRVDVVDTGIVVVSGPVVCIDVAGMAVLVVTL